MVCGTALVFGKGVVILSSGLLPTLRRYVQELFFVHGYPSMLVACLIVGVGHRNILVIILIILLRAAVEIV